MAGTKSCGILVNLETVLELFSSFIPDHDNMVMDTDIYEDEDFQTPLVNVYPQAFWRKMGHIQCNMVLPQFGLFLTLIQKSITQSVHGVDTDDEIDDEDKDLFNPNEGHVPPAVLAVHHMSVLQ